MSQSSHYQLTRKHGKRAKVITLCSKVADPATGQKAENANTYDVRFVFKSRTKTSRMYAAKSANQDVGETTFVFFYQDLDVAMMNAEDKIMFDGEDYVVKTSEFISGEGLIVTAKQIRSQ